MNTPYAYGILRLSGGLDVLEVNETFRATFGADPKSLGKPNFESLLPPNDMRALLNLHRTIASYAGGIVELGLNTLCCGGSEFLVRLRIARDGKDWLVYAENVGFDNNMIYQLKLAAERWQAILSGSTEAVVVLDEKNRIVEFNSAFFELMSYMTDNGVLISEDALTLRDFTKITKDKAFVDVIGAVSRRDIEPGQIFRKKFWRGKRFLDAQVFALKLPVKGLAGHVIVIGDRTDEHELEQQRVKSAHYCGKSEAATGVIHNLGNVLNSVKISAHQIRETLENCHIDGLIKAGELLSKNAHRLAEFLGEDERGRLLPQYLSDLGRIMAGEKSSLEEEIERLRKKIDTAAEVIEAQQSFARGVALSEPINLCHIVEDALRIQGASLASHGVHVVKKGSCETPPWAKGQSSKLIHVILNLLTNAQDAVEVMPCENRELVIESGSSGPDTVFLRFSDNGAGIDPANKERIFAHGFTTKPTGHGFGLHFCATAMTEMDGKITLESDGPGHGTRVTLFLPKSVEHPACDCPLEENRKQRMQTATFGQTDTQGVQAP